MLKSQIASFHLQTKITCFCGLCLLKVAGLASVMGVTVDKYKGNCSEVDQLCNDLEKLLR